VRTPLPRPDASTRDIAGQSRTARVLRTPNTQLGTLTEARLKLTKRAPHGHHRATRLIIAMRDEHGSRSAPCNEDPQQVPISLAMPGRATCDVTDIAMSPAASSSSFWSRPCDDVVGNGWVTSTP